MMPDGIGRSGKHVDRDDVLVHLLQRRQPVINDTLRLAGKAIIEDMNFNRACIGRLPVSEVACADANPWRGTATETQYRSSPRTVWKSRLCSTGLPRITGATPYCSCVTPCFIAMQMIRRLLKALGAKQIGDLGHHRFQQAKQLVEEHGERYFIESSQDIDQTLKALHGNGYSDLMIGPGLGSASSRLATRD